MSVLHERAEHAASELQILLASRPVGPHLLTVGFEPAPPRLHVYLKKHGFAVDVPGRFKNFVVETHYTRVAP